MFRLHKHKVNTAPEWNLSKEPGPFLILFFFLRYFSHVFLTFAFSHIANQLLGFSISRLANVEHFFNVYILFSILLKTSFLLPHLFEFEFSWFHNNQTVIRDFNSQNRCLPAWVSKWDKYWNYWVLISDFEFTLDASDIDLRVIDLLDTHLVFLVTDIPS